MIGVDADVFATLPHELAEDVLCRGVCAHLLVVAMDDDWLVVRWKRQLLRHLQRLERLEHALIEELHLRGLDWEPLLVRRRELARRLEDRRQRLSGRGVLLFELASTGFDVRVVLARIELVGAHVACVR